MNQLIEATLDTLLERIENGDGAWLKEWVGGGMPRNFTTEKNYRGINTLLLWCYREKNEYPTQDWATYKQWADAGYQVSKGQKSSVIFIHKDAVKKGGNPDNPDDHYRLLKCAFVFNAAQLESPPMVDEPIDTGFTTVDLCEQTIRGTLARVIEDGQPAYSPVLDAIKMPPGYAFHTAEAYYCTYFHELTHWSGHRSRLARTGLSYAEEELVAEFGAAFLCASHGIDGVNDNAAAYIRSWLKQIKVDRAGALMKAASQASKAAEYITGLKEAHQQNELVA